MYFITTLSSSPSSLASQSVQQAKTVFFGGKKSGNWWVNAKIKWPTQGHTGTSPGVVTPIVGILYFQAKGRGGWLAAGAWRAGMWGRVRPEWRGGSTTLWLQDAACAAGKSQVLASVYIRMSAEALMARAISQLCSAHQTLAPGVRRTHVTFPRAPFILCCGGLLLCKLKIRASGCAPVSADGTGKTALVGSSNNIRPRLTPLPQHIGSGSFWDSLSRNPPQTPPSLQLKCHPHGFLQAELIAISFCPDTWHTILLFHLPYYIVTISFPYLTVSSSRTEILSD